MGYVYEEQTHRIKFDSRPGLEMVTESVPIGVLLRLTALAELLGEGAGQKEALAEVLAAGDLSGRPAQEVAGLLSKFSELGELYVAFGERLISWTLEKRPKGGGDPVPVPATLDGLLGQTLEFSLELLMGWLQAIGAVGASDPLAPPSNGGAPYPEESIQMAPLPTPSLAS